jgi:hypothetical protein
VLPAWDGSETASAGSKFGFGFEKNWRFRPFYLAVSLFENGSGKALRYHKKLPNSPGLATNLVRFERLSQLFTLLRLLVGLCAGAQLLRLGHARAAVRGPAAAAARGGPGAGGNRGRGLRRKVR